MTDRVSKKSPDDDATPKVTAAKILQHEVREGLDALERPAFTLFVSALSAGLDVGFSLLLMAVVFTDADGKLPPPIVKWGVACMYSVGFIFVILGRSELFTEQTTLAVLPVLRGKATIASLLRLWGIVYVANLIGATAFAGGISFIGPALGVIEPRAFGHIAGELIDHSGGVIFLGALLAGWLMGLLSWMVSAARDTISQIVIVFMVTTAIGLGGLQHSIVGSVEVLAAVFAHQGVGMGDFARFLLWATLGNIVGGSVFVALIKYGHAKPE
jgi:formate/nitrite transporter FocA (FNT family)